MPACMPGMDREPLRRTGRLLEGPCKETRWHGEGAAELH